MPLERLHANDAVHAALQSDVALFAEHFRETIM